MTAPAVRKTVRALHQAFARRFGESAARAKLETAVLLRTLARSRPGGRLLELGTGFGFATRFLASGLVDGATLISVEYSEELVAFARRTLKGIESVEIVCEDAAVFLQTEQSTFDLVFADAEPGKFTHLEDALGRVAPGGLYVVDDMNALLDWTPEHRARVDAMRRALEERRDFSVRELATGTGLLVATRRP